MKVRGQCRVPQAKPGLAEGGEVLNNLSPQLEFVAQFVGFLQVF